MRKFLPALNCSVCHKPLTQRVIAKGRSAIAVAVCDKCSNVLCHRCRAWDGKKGVYFCKKGRTKKK